MQKAEEVTDGATASAVNYREVLIAYMRHVERCEGVSCLHDWTAIDGLDDRENAALLAAYAESGLDC